MIDSAAEAGRKIKALAGTKATDDAFLTVTLSTSRLDDWRLSVPSFLRSEFRPRRSRERQVEGDQAPAAERPRLRARHRRLRGDSEDPGTGRVRRRQAALLGEDRAALPAAQPSRGRALALRPPDRPRPLAARAIRARPGEPGRIEPLPGGRVGHRPGGRSDRTVAEDQRSRHRRGLHQGVLRRRPARDTGRATLQRGRCLARQAARGFEDPARGPVSPSTT